MLNLVGKVFGRLTVLKREGEFQMCQCSCGEKRLVRTDRLRSGKTKSCGCLAAELNAASKKAAEEVRASRASAKAVYEKRTRLERQLAAVWCTMKQRCNNPNYVDYKYYGARGIAVCQRWNDSSEQFIADMLPLYSPGMWLERVDNNAGYSPENCVFATPKQQAANRRRYGTALPQQLAIFQ